MTGSAEFKLLGPLEVVRAGARVAVPAGRQRALLVALLLRPGLPVPADLLLREVWGPDRSASARTGLNVCAMRLRRSLADPDGSLVRTERGGYSVAVDAQAVDVHRFRTLLAAAERAGAQDRPDDEWQLLGEALELWRGDALADVSAPVLLAEVRPRLEEERLRAVERHADLWLLHGGHAHLVPRLRELVERHPFREHLWCQLARALYGSGRRDEALRACRHLRRLLRDELGVTPGAELQWLEAGLLADDPGVLLLRGPPDPVVIRRELPRPAPLVGRAAELAALRAGFRATAPVLTVDGMPGVGKTALAYAAVRAVAERYPDGIVPVHLRGHRRPGSPLSAAAGLEQLLRSVGVPADGIPPDLDERSALWRSASAGRRLLVVLDDAVCSRQVVPLLPAGPGCAVLVTSRRRLADLEPTAGLSLDVLAGDAAAELLGALLPGASGDPGAVRAVVAATGGLPLALCLAAARARRAGWSVRRLAAQLDAVEVLPELVVGERTVTRAFDTSYEGLPERSRALFRLLGRLGGEVDAARVTASAGAPAEAGLEHLVDLHLLRQPAPGRYRLAPLLGEYAVRLDRAHTGRPVS